MTLEEKEAANAALALDELIEQRVWDIIEKDRWRVDALVLEAIRRNTMDIRKEIEAIRYLGGCHALRK